MENITQKIINDLSKSQHKNFRVGDLLIQSLEDCLGSDIFHFRVSDFDQSLNVTGSGSDFHAEIALKKALSEFCERYSHSKLGIEGSSSGYAAHENITLSKESALAEIVERDVFLSCWLSKLPPLWLSDQVLEEICPIFSEQKNIFRKSNLNIRIGVLGICMDVIVIFGELTPDADSKEKFGRIIVSSGSKSFEYAIRKAIIDLRRSANFVFNQSVQVSNSVDLKSPFYHISHYANPNFSENLSWLDVSDLSELIRIIDPILDIEYIEHINSYKDIYPAIIIQARSKECQNYFVGPTTIDKVNMNRVRQFGITSFSQLNLNLHPLG